MSDQSLSDAARHNDTILVSKLLHIGASPSAVGRDGSTPVHVAATSGTSCQCEASFHPARAAGTPCEFFVRFTSARSLMTDCRRAVPHAGSLSSLEVLLRAGDYHSIPNASGDPVCFRRCLACAS